MFTTPGPLDFVAIARTTREFWDREQVFTRLVSRNRGGPRFSFIDGPITANNPMGIHHAWGRTAKDVIQRYKAMSGYDQRFQNGFDCQGLWVEVEVEKTLGFDSKREIESFGLERFSRACRERVLHFAEHPDRAIQEAGAVDGLAELVLHDVGPQHRAQLALSPAVPRARLALRGTPRDAVVRAMRDLDLAARDAGRLRRCDPRVGDGGLPARRPARPPAPRVDDDAVDAAGQRGGGGSPGPRLCRVRVVGGRLLRRRAPRQPIPGARAAAAHGQGGRPRGARATSAPSTTCPPSAVSSIA